MNNISIEIQFLILDNLEDEGIFNGMLVCKSWYKKLIKKQLDKKNMSLYEIYPGCIAHLKIYISNKKILLDFSKLCDLKGSLGRVISTITINNIPRIFIGENYKREFGTPILLQKKDKEYMVFDDHIYNFRTKDNIIQYCSYDNYIYDGSEYHCDGPDTYNKIAVGEKYIYLLNNYVYFRKKLVPDDIRYDKEMYNYFDSIKDETKYYSIEILKDKENYLV